MTRWIAILLGTLAALAACKTAAETGGASGDDLVAAAVAAEAPTSALPSRPDTTRSAAAQDSDVAAQERARRELLDQKTQELVQYHLANARTLEEQLRFEEALRELEKAQRLDPGNPVVLETMRQVQALLGMPQGQAALERMSARQRYEAQRQQMRALALAELDAAQRALDAEDYERAVTLARGVVNRITWSADTVDWGPIAGDARELLAEAERLAATQGEELARRKQEEAFRRLREEEEGQVRQEAERVRSLLIAATEAFDRADYEAAERLAQAVLEIDKHDSQALAILDAAQDAAREYADRRFIQRRREEFNVWRNKMEAVRIPTSAIYTDPDAAHWADITARRGSLRSLDLGERDPEEAALRQVLADTRMDVDFEDRTITEVANAITFAQDIPVSVDPEVVIELDDNAETVTMRLRNVTVEAFLNVLVERVGTDLAWTIRNGRVYITRRDKAQGRVLPRVHRIQDLTFKLTDFKGTNIREIPLPGEAGDDPETTIFSSELDQVTLIEPEEILNLVRENIATEDWDLSDAYQIDFVDNNNLLVIHTPEVQAQVARFLDDLRTFSTSMVTLESRFFSITDAFIEEIGTDLRGLDPQGPFASEYTLGAAGVGGGATQGLDNLGAGNGAPVAGVFFEDGGDQVYSMASENFFSNPLGNLLSTVGGAAFQFTILDDTEVNIVMNLVSKSQNALEITAPMVSVYNTQRAFVTVVNQVSFVQGFDVDVATAAFIADPIVGVVQEGIVLDVRPTISYDRKYITLDVQTTVAELERPFPSVSTLLGPNGSPVTFSIPVLNVQDAQTTVVVPDGGAVVLGGFKHVRYKNRTAETPWFADIPILGFFFREKGLADEVTDLIVVIRAKITDFSHLRQA